MVVEAGKRGTEVEGEGEVAKVGDQKGTVPADEGGGIIVMEGEEGGGTGRERAGGRGSHCAKGYQRGGRETLGSAREIK